MARLYSRAVNENGTGGKAFTVIQPDLGTAPIATGPNDTLTLTSSDGSVTITGNSSTDTIDLNVNAGSIVTGFTQGSVIFAGASGVLSQNNSAFFWDNTKDVLTLTQAYSTNTSSEAIRGFVNTPTVTLTGDVANSGYAGEFIRQTTNGAGHNITGTGGVQGLSYQAYWQGAGTTANLSGVSGVAVNDNAGTVTQARGISSTITNNSTGTITSAITYQAGLSNTSGTVTSYAGYFIGDNSAAASTHYGYYSGASSGTNKYNFYAPGTAQNYFAGNVGIGVDPPVYPLDVATTLSAGSSVYVARGENLLFTKTQTATNAATGNAIRALSFVVNSNNGAFNITNQATEVGITGQSIVDGSGTLNGLSAVANNANAGTKSTFTGTLGTATGSAASVSNKGIGTITNAVAYQAAIDNAAGGAIGTYYGFLSIDPIGTAPTVASYGLYSNLASGSNKYNFYAAGTAINYFAGSVGIGTTTPTYALEVNGNGLASNWANKATAVTSAGGTTTLSVSSTYIQNLQGSSAQTFKLPDATTLNVGYAFLLNNNSTGLLTLQNNGAGAITTVPAGGSVLVYATSISTANGAWDYRFLMPSNASYGTSSLTVTGSIAATTRSTGGVFALTDGATPALDASLADLFTLTTTTNPTIAVPTNAVSGQKIVLAVTASGGARTLALNTGAGGFRFGSDITALTAIASGKTDYVGCIYNSGASFWDVVAYTKGF